MRSEENMEAVVISGSISADEFESRLEVGEVLLREAPGSEGKDLEREVLAAFTSPREEMSEHEFQAYLELLADEPDEP